MHIGCTLQEESVADNSSEALDSQGIPGWDRVDHLARALLNLTGLCVSNSEAEEIRRLFDNLMEFDKRPIQFQPRSYKPSRGQFGRSKSTANVSVDAMKRSVLQHYVT